MRRDIPVRRSRAASWARVVGALAVPVLALGALGNRAGLVPPDALVPVLGLGFALGLAGLGIGAYALIDIWRSGAEGTGRAVAGIVYALPALILLGLVAGAAIMYPRLTDVTTNLGDPPALQTPRSGAAGMPDPEFLNLQVEAYPDLAPRLYPLPIANVYASVRALADTRNWEVTEEVPPPSLPPPAEASAAAPPASDPDASDPVLDAKATMTQSRGSAAAEAAERAAQTTTAAPAAEEAPPMRESAELQAVARTFLFGFPDDVVIRLRETSQGTQVDMRSASRTGMHDLGQNARRIRRFLADLDVALQPDPNAPAPPASPPAGAVPVPASPPASAAAPSADADPVSQ